MSTAKKVQAGLRTLCCRLRQACVGEAHGLNRVRPDGTNFVSGDAVQS